jgi:hypothetical protein
MTHFYTDSIPTDDLPAAQRDRMKVLNTPWPGFKARVERDVGGQTVLIVMPTDVPFVKNGTPLVCIGREFPILVPDVKEPGKYKDVRGLIRAEYDWWISRATEDPNHLILAWNGRDELPSFSQNLPSNNHNLITLVGN